MTCPGTEEEEDVEAEQSTATRLAAAAWPRSHLSGRLPCEGIAHPSNGTLTVAARGQTRLEHAGGGGRRKAPLHWSAGLLHRPHQPMGCLLSFTPRRTPAASHRPLTAA